MLNNLFLRRPYNLLHFNFDISKKLYCFCPPFFKCYLFSISIRFYSRPLYFLLLHHYPHILFLLFGFSMNGVFPAKFTVFSEFKSIRIVLLVLLSCVVSVLALCTFKMDYHSRPFCSHLILFTST